MPVCAESSYSQLLQLRLVGCAVTVDERKVRFGANVSRRDCAVQFLPSREHAGDPVHGVVGFGMQVTIIVKIKRREMLFLAGFTADSLDIGDFVNLEVQRPSAIGNNMIFREPIGESYSIESLRKEIDCRRAKQLESRNINAVLESKCRMVERNDNLEQIPLERGESGLHLADLEKQKALWKCEVLSD